MQRILLPIGVLVLAIVVWLALPLVTNQTVDEPPPTLTDAELDALHAIETLTPQQVERMTTKKREEAKQTMETLAEKMPDVSIAEALPATEADVIASGTFRGVDTLHRGAGMATVYRQADGAHVLRLEKFTVTNGPALHVYLVRDRGGDPASGFVDLGRLKGNKGNQNYDIPEDIDIAQFKGVVIWCKPFGVTFAVAGL